MSKDVFQMERGWGEHDMFLGDEYSRRDAWAWLIEHACWKATRTRIKGEIVELQRGQLCYSVRFLAEKWGWNKNKVHRFLTELRSRGMIMQSSKSETTDGTSLGQGASVTSICNYDKYQFTPKAAGTKDGTSNGTSLGHQRDKEEEGKSLFEPKGSSGGDVGEGDQPPPPAPKHDVAGAFDEWCAAAKINGWRVPQGLPDARRKKLAARLDAYGNKGWTEALAKASASPFLTDPSNRSWFDFDWMTKNDQNILKVLEDKYSGGAAQRPEDARYVPGNHHTEAELAASREQLLASGELNL